MEYSYSQNSKLQNLFHFFKSLGFLGKLVIGFCLFIFLSLLVGSFFLYFRDPAEKSVSLVLESNGGKLSGDDSPRNQVISYLQEKEYEHCEVIREDNISSGNIDFSLLCNSRPFMAKYRNGKVSYDYNGWGFLMEQPQILEELSKNSCNLYAIQNDNVLDFTCEDWTVRTYQYDEASFTFRKKNEEPAKDYLFGVWGKIHPSCKLMDGERVGWAGKVLLRFDLECDGYQTVLYFDPKTLAFTLPVVMDSDLSEEDRLEKSIELTSFSSCSNLEPPKALVPSYVSKLSCAKNGKVHLQYNYQMPMESWAMFSEEQIKKTGPLVFWNAFPQLVIEGEKLDLKTVNTVGAINYYLGAGRVLAVQVPTSGAFIREVSLKGENVQK